MYDRHWTGHLRTALASSGIILTLTMVLDALAGSLTLPRAALWTGLSALVFGVLLPSRVTAGSGWLAVRGLVRKRRVRTDFLVDARLDGGIDRRLHLRDAFGTRVDVSPRVLSGNPFLWHELDRGARRSYQAGTLPSTGVLDILAEQIDSAEARRLLESAGLRS
ncbi:hypothetical protein GA0115240_10479 [Streptomyces sp. DvalAA-14]|nr:hypothetical protein [Streptomyces sp. SID4948]SCD36686.1 hypothetical protein GA0115240_10479 [Streptomyces sp. DvalAA-14]